MKSYGALIILYVVFTLVFSVGYKRKWQFNHPSPAFFNVYGLDVSHHQGEVNWDVVDVKKYKFVYLKATEGESFKDTKFLENYTAAKATGLVVGGYHFWSFCRSLEKQLANLMETIPLSAGDLIPAIDIESTQSCKSEKRIEDILGDLKVINSTIKKRYGSYPVIYTTKDFAASYPEVLSFENIYWLRSLMGPPVYKKNWSLWQYHSNGSVQGFKGPVDLNVLSKKVLFESIVQI